MEFNYKKSLGQNFIYDHDFLRSLVKDLAIQPTDNVVEVGAGAGTLTRVLAEYGCQVHSIEIDQRLAPILQKNLAPYDNVTLTFGDALQQDFTDYGQFRLIANVPYYITTPLLLKFLTLSNCTDVNILVADEVARRIVAPVGTAEYGALSVTCQWLAECSIIKDVPRHLFTPQPKIDSAFVRLVKKDVPTDAHFNQVVKGIFAGRRKTLLNALTTVLRGNKQLAKQVLAETEIDPNLRPEQLSPTNYWQITQKIRNFDK